MRWLVLLRHNHNELKLRFTVQLFYEVSAVGSFLFRHERGEAMQAKVCIYVDIKNQKI